MGKWSKRAFQLLKGCLYIVYPNMETVGVDLLPEEPCMIVANHAQMHGPIAGELFFPRDPYIWCRAEMMNAREVPQYAFTDFWSFKPRWTHWFYRGLAHAITPLAVLLFNNARTIGVRTDMRIMSTLRETSQRLQEGRNVIVFPEYNRKCNNILYDFQDGFINIARMYYKKTGRALSFVPMYIAPKLKQMVLGKPIPFDPEAPIEEERARICAELMEAITRIGQGLPRHTVIPYRNVPKKEYPCNVPNEVSEK